MKILFALLLLGSCSTAYKNNGYARRDVEQYYSSVGVVKYFLPDLPNWANTSISANCGRQFPIRYFDFEKLIQSFSLNYEQLLQVQLMFNNDSYQLMKSGEIKFLPLRDEERLFLEVIDKVQSHLGLFKTPTFKRIHLIWIDQMINDRKLRHRFQSLMNSKDMDLGRPVLVSLCLSRQELQEFLGQYDLDRGDYRYLTFEMLSPFDHNGQRQIIPSIELDVLFEGKEVYLYTPDDRPVELNGSFKIRKY